MSGVKRAIGLALVSLVLGYGAPAMAAAKAQDAGGEQDKPLNLDQARAYMLTLINRDRASKGVGPVQLDDIATKAAQLHADTMVQNQYSSHWHPDGKKPPQRFSECGGYDFVAENSHGASGAKQFNYVVPDQQTFTPAEIEAEEGLYFNEKPPADGHRLNILDSGRTNVGIGLKLVELQWKDGPTTYRKIASAQEFLNKHVDKCTQSEDHLERGKTYTMSGEILPKTDLKILNVWWEPAPTEISIKTLRDQTEPKYHGSYPGPEKTVAIVGAGPGTHTDHAKLKVDGNHFTVEINPADDWAPGLYYVMLWGQVPGHTDNQSLTLHTVPLP